MTAHLMWIAPRGGESVDPYSFDLQSYIGPTLAEFDADLFGAPTPQAFRAELGDATGGLLTHFHPVDQFQYFIVGECTFGRHHTAPGVVHYSDRFTPYGPIRPRPGGVAFLTLRTRCDFGAFAMPAARNELATGIKLAAQPPNPRRVIPCNVVEHAGRETWARLVDHDDGLAIRERVPLEGGASITLPAIAATGAYVVVTSGSVVADSTEFGRWSLAYVADLPAGAIVTAGPSGAGLALFQFPATTPAGGVPVTFDPFAHRSANIPPELAARLQPTE